MPLVEGVETLQIEYGLDAGASTTGSPSVYTANPDTYNGCVPAACTSYWRNTVSAKLNVLARNSAVTPGYVDTKIYTLGLNADGTVNAIGPFGDGYKRHTFSEIVRLNNPAGRNAP